MYAMEHVPFEFYQPYTRLLEFDLLAGQGDSAALISGIVIAISMFGGAIGASISVNMRKKVGLIGVFMAALLVFVSRTVVDVSSVDWIALSSILRICLVMGIVGLISLMLLYPKVKKLM